MVRHPRRPTVVLITLLAVFLGCGKAKHTDEQAPLIAPEETPAVVPSEQGSSMIDDLLEELPDNVPANEPLPKAQVQEAAPQIYEQIVRGLREARDDQWFTESKRLEQFFVSLAQTTKKTDDELVLVFALMADQLRKAADELQATCVRNIPGVPPIPPGTAPAYARQLRQYHAQRIAKNRASCKASAQTGVTYNLTLLQALVFSQKKSSFAGQLPVLYQALTGKTLDLGPTASGSGGGTGSGSGTGTGSGTGSGSGTGTLLGTGIGMGF